MQRRRRLLMILASVLVAALTVGPAAALTP